MTPTISTDTAVAHLSRLLHSPPERLLERELAARQTLIIVNAILHSPDAPSAYMVGSRPISDFHAAWLATLPHFSDVAFISQERDFNTGEPYLRLYLLSDWLDTAAQRRKRDDTLRERSEAWLTERVRWYRLRRRLMDQYEIGVAAAQAQIEAHRDALSCRYEVARKAVENLLRMLGFYEDVSEDDRRVYAMGLQHSESLGHAGHAFASVTDFLGFP